MTVNKKLLFPVPVSLLVFPVQLHTCIYTSFCKLQLQWHSNYHETMISLKKENIGSCSKQNCKMLLPIYISWGLVLQVGWSMRVGGQWTMRLWWPSCRHRAGGTHSDIAEPTLQLLPSHSMCPSLIFTSSLLSYPVNQKRDFPILLLLLSALLKPLLLTGSHAIN